MPTAEPAAPTPEPAVPAAAHTWHDGHDYRVLPDGTFQGKSPGDPEDAWQTLDRWQHPTFAREALRLASAEALRLAQRVQASATALEVKHA